MYDTVSHNVTNNLTGHRIHLEGPQIYQINRQTNSFQNMCDMLYVKIDRLARKNTSKSAIFVYGFPEFGRPWT